MVALINRWHLSLKWKLISLFVALIMLLSTAMIFWIRLSFENYVKNAEICRFRSSAISALRAQSKNYYTSRDIEAFRSAVTELKKNNPGITTVFISGDDGLIADENNEKAEKMFTHISSSTQSHNVVDCDSIVDIDGERQVVVSYKEEFDPYTLHFGFSASVIKTRTRDLALRVSFVVILAGLIVLLLGAAFLHIIISPIEKVAKDAERLSFGDLKTKLQRGSRTEVGRIYGSLSRLKESILYSIKRLDMR